MKLKVQQYSYNLTLRERKLELLKKYPESNSKLRLVRQQIENEIAEIECELLEVENYLSSLSDIQREIIELKYINNHTWEYTSAKMGFSVSGCQYHIKMLE